MVALDTLAPPREGIRFQQPQTRAFLLGQDAGLGTLFVAESCLAWVSESGTGFSLQYPSISIHAISRDSSAFPHDCIYAMLDVAPTDITGVRDAANGDNEVAMEGGEESGEAEDSDGGGVSELRFVPLDASVLESLYKAICECQVLHPDPDADSDPGECFGDPEADFADADWEEEPANGDAAPPTGDDAMDQ